MAEDSHFEVAPIESGRRLDKFLAERFPEISRSVVARIIEEGGAAVDGVAATKAMRLKPGQRVSFRLPAPRIGETEILPEPIPLTVLHEDDDIVAIAKEPGICVHPSPGHYTGTLVNGLLQRYPGMAYVGSIRRPGVVHRLDLDTSGVILFAISPRAYLALVRMIRERAVKREYLAVVHGIVLSESGTINMPIGRDPEHRRRFKVMPAGGGAKSAVTHFEVGERLGNATLLRVRLDTGRTHQIRVHMKAIGHPVCGDAVYGSGRPSPPIARQALHAQKLSFRHPFLGQDIVIESPLPRDITELLATLRGSHE